MASKMIVINQDGAAFYAVPQDRMSAIMARLAEPAQRRAAAPEASAEDTQDGPAAPVSKKARGAREKPTEARPITEEQENGLA